MRVTFVLPRFDLSGGNRVVAIYADGLRERGHTVLTVAPKQRPPRLRKVARSLATGKGWPRSSSRSHFDGLQTAHRELDHRAPLADADLPDADVVIATWWETAEWVQALAPAKGTKVHFMQDYEVWGGPTTRVDATCALPMPKIVIAQWTADLLAEKFHRAPLALIPNSVDTQVFNAPPRVKQATPTVGLTYTSFRNKGTDISIKAVEIARKTLPELRLVAFGAETPSFRMPLPPGTEYFARVPDGQLREVYASCDAWLFGTRIEGFGLPILEAMACRTPVIGTPGGAAPEILGRGGGFLVPHESPEAMAEAILKVAAMSDAEWRGISDEADRIARLTDWDDAVDRFEAALRIAIG